MSTHLEARRLTCGYGRRRVLEALSLAAQAGEVLVLLGPNGAGKTTLLRALARLLPPQEGQVLLYDRDVWTLPPRLAAREIALMPQSERRDWPLTVEECVRLGRAPHRGWLLPYASEDRRIVEEALQAAELLELRERPITELSGGEWRRMALARAVAQQARVLLLDEPTAGLDLKYQAEMLRLVRGMAVDKQLVVVLTLHDLNQAALYGDRLALLARHELAALGPAEEVLTAERISRVYGVPVAVMPHPVYQTPMVVPLVAEPSPSRPLGSAPC
jgi:iron complex transport system ATP-binding protein